MSKIGKGPQQARRTVSDFIHVTRTSGVVPTQLLLKSPRI